MRFEVGDPKGGGGARSTAVTSGNYGTGESACVCMRAHANEEQHPSSSRIVYTGYWIGAGNSLQLE